MSDTRVDELFTTPPPGRSLIKPADPNKLAPQDPEGIKPPVPMWGPAAHSPPEVLALLDYPHEPGTGMPVEPPPPYRDKPPPTPPGATDEQAAAWTAHWARKYDEWEEAGKAYWTRFKFYRALDANLISQLKADLAGRTATGPWWAARATYNTEHPHLLVRAPDLHAAADAYRTLCGITPWVNKAGHTVITPVDVTPYVEQPAPAA
jgi:hypothetical protein